MLQDPNLSWYTDDPDLTECFQKTVLIWTPCIFLWVFSSFEAYYLLKSKRRNVPFTWLFVSKFLLTSALILLSIVDLGKSIRDSYSDITVYDVDYCTPCVKILTFVSDSFKDNHFIILISICTLHYLFENI